MTPIQKLYVGLVTLLTLTVGCSPQEEMLDFVETDMAKIKVDDLTRAMDFVRAEVRFDQREFIDQVTNGLNRWVTYSEETGEWEADPLFQQVVDQFPNLPAAQRVSESKFLNTDAYYLQQCYWLDKLTKRLAASKRVQTFELYRLAADDFKPSGDENEDAVLESIRRLHPAIESEENLVKLATAFKLFDWTCRNIQLASDAVLDDDEADDRRLNENESEAAAGIPGLGYQRFPWQAMVYGRGDYVERAKVVLAGLRFLDIDAVMLAAGTDQRPWAIGVAINDDYYLFDPKLGLPIPGKELGTIASLSELRANPDHLESLDLTTEESLADDTDYWVKKDQLDSLIAYVYASPESASMRMKRMQDSLVGDSRLRIAFTAREVADRLPDVAGVTVKPWDIAFRTHQFRQAIRVALEDAGKRDKLKWYFLTEGYIDGFRPFRTARGRFFQGKFVTPAGERALNALEGWQLLIYDDDQIASLGSDTELQTRHGIRKQDQSAAEFESMVNSVQGQMRLIRVDAKFFLAQCLFDNKNENAAGSWLEDLRSNDDDRWLEGVTYLLGRSYESRKDYDQAIKTLKDESLNQAHGNILRARLLTKLIAKYYGDVDQTASEESAQEEPGSEDADNEKSGKEEPSGQANDAGDQDAAKS